MAGNGKREELTANGQTAELRIRGKLKLSLSGSFGAGTAQLEQRDPDGNWIAVVGASYTVAVDATFNWPARAKNDVRIALTGATTPTLIVWVQGDSASLP